MERALGAEEPLGSRGAVGDRDPEVFARLRRSGYLLPTRRVGKARANRSRNEATDRRAFVIYSRVAFGPDMGECAGGLLFGAEHQGFFRRALVSDEDTGRVLYGWLFRILSVRLDRLAMGWFGVTWTQIKRAMSLRG